MSRRQRQMNELRALCSAGAAARAVDLAFAHLADFGLDDEVLSKLASAVGGAPVPPAVRVRYAELVARVARVARSSCSGAGATRYRSAHAGRAARRRPEERRSGGGGST